MNTKLTLNALQNHTAKLSSSINIILTRNLKDYKNSLLPVMTPKTNLSVGNAYQKQKD